MPVSDTEQSVTIAMEGTGGKTISCSALLERDPGFLSWNRISLLGNHSDWVSTLQIKSEGSIKWTIYQNPNWPRPDDDQATGGLASLNWTGRASGTAISSETVQKFAELQVIKFWEPHFQPEAETNSVEYWFMQRPQDWFVFPRKIPKTYSLEQRGDWFRIGKLNLKFRCVTVGHLRDDLRISQETELINVPAIEVTPIDKVRSSKFCLEADALWFDLRILLTFRYRQIIDPLAEFRTTPEKAERIWHPVKILPRERRLSHREDPPFYGRIDQFLAKGAASLAKYRDHRERIHAAVFGYAASYKSVSWEAGLTSAVEAIERLVSVFEAISGHGRDYIERKEWSKISKTLRNSLDGMQLDAEKLRVIKSSLAHPVSLSLHDRILRMINAQKGRWKSGPIGVLSGLPNMIRNRNAIVHGRMVDDHSELYAEMLRARLIFEKLFVNFVDCHTFSQSGWPEWVISSIEERREADENIGISRL